MESAVIKICNCCKPQDVSNNFRKFVQKTMNHLILNLENEIGQDFEEVYGQNLEQKLESLGFDVKFPSNTDWGYVFRVKYKKHEFDIIIQKKEKAENSILITINSTLNKLEKFFGIKDSEELIALKKVIDEIK